MKTVPYIIGLALVVSTAAWYLFLLCRESATLLWPSTAGEMLASSIETSGTALGEGYKIKVKYIYKVNDTTYVSERCRLYDLSSDFYWIPNWRRKRLPVGKRVHVYYNPKNPNEAVLMRGANLSIFVMIALALPLILNIMRELNLIHS